jgi:hypothetical protein
MDQTSQKHQPQRHQEEGDHSKPAKRSLDDADGNHNGDSFNRSVRFRENQTSVSSSLSLVLAPSTSPSAQRNENAAIDPIISNTSAATLEIGAEVDISLEIAAVNGGANFTGTILAYIPGLNRYRIESTDGMLYLVAADKLKPLSQVIGSGECWWLNRDDAGGTVLLNFSDDNIAVERSYGDKGDDGDHDDGDGDDDDDSLRAAKLESVLGESRRDLFASKIHTLRVAALMSNSKKSKAGSKTFRVDREVIRDLL